MLEPTLVLLQGLPRSGKTTFIANAIDEAIGFGNAGVVVNPDAIRRALHGHRFIPEAEDHVWAIAFTMARALFFSGHTLVYVDATNTTRKRRDPWTAMARKLEVACNLLVVRTDADTCRARAESQGDDVLLPVIERMLDQWEEPTREEGWEKITLVDGIEHYSLAR